MKKRMFSFNAETEALITQLKVFFGVTEESEVLEMAISLAGLNMEHSSHDGRVTIVDQNTSKIVNIDLKKPKAGRPDNLAPSNYLLN